MIKTKILIVDDEETLCEVLKLNLEAEGYEADTAYSAEEALQLGLSQYSLILLDIMMGEMNGIQMARRLKDAPATRHIPIIFCTAKDTEDDMVLGLNLGADDYKSYSCITTHLPSDFRPTRDNNPISRRRRVWLAIDERLTLITAAISSNVAVGLFLITSSTCC
jgi:CheY-like chemotaxis protein